MKTIILLGAPGAGKGTIADGLRQQTRYIHVSTGDMLRAALKSGTPLGLQAKAFMERGELVPDAVIMDMIRERLARGGPEDQYMFDGFPRTLEQARQLDDLLAGFQARVDHVFLLDVPRNIIIDRITGRRVCKTCGKVYHVRNLPPQTAERCDADGGPLIQRADDCEAVVVNRLEVYEKQTAPLIDYYRRKGLLAAVDGAGPRAQTESRIVAHLNGRPGAP